MMNISNERKKRRKIYIIFLRLLFSSRYAWTLSEDVLKIQNLQCWRETALSSESVDHVSGEIKTAKSRKLISTFNRGNLVIALEKTSNV